MHEDYQDEAIPIDFGLQHLHIYVLSPVDLAVSKIVRLAGNDLEDIQSLVRQGLTNSHAIAQRAKSVSSNKNVSYKALKGPNLSVGMAKSRTNVLFYTKTHQNPAGTAIANRYRFLNLTNWRFI